MSTGSINEQGARERILKTAERLFRSSGYPTTGINRIISESETAKASFYQHFPAKEQLAQEYLRVYGNQQLEILQRLMARNPVPAAFTRAWLQLIKRQIRQGNFYGCQMANFRAQLADDTAGEKKHVENRLLLSVKEVTENTLKLLEDYLEGAVRLNRLPACVNPDVSARRLLAVYEGVLQVYRLTGKVAALDDLVFLSDCLWQD